MALEPQSAVVVEPDNLRQVFNDTGSGALWLVAGAPPESANTLEMSAEEIARRYPNGLRALPPELDGGSCRPDVRRYTFNC